MITGAEFGRGIGTEIDFCQIFVEIIIAGTGINGIEGTFGLCVSDAVCFCCRPRIIQDFIIREAHVVMRSIFTKRTVPTIADHKAEIMVFYLEIIVGSEVDRSIGGFAAVVLKGGHASASPIVLGDQRVVITILILKHRDIDISSDFQTVEDFVFQITVSQELIRFFFVFILPVCDWIG